MIDTPDTNTFVFCRALVNCGTVAGEAGCHPGPLQAATTA
jgi:hypothetical protein